MKKVSFLKTAFVLVSVFGMSGCFSVADSTGVGFEACETDCVNFGFETLFDTL